jgi:hypothetical protein
MRDESHLRAFARRDWAAAARDKEIYWRDWKRAHGPGAGILLGDELRRHVLAMQPAGPSEREREEDLAAHLRLIDAIHRVPRRDR